MRIIHILPHALDPFVTADLSNSHALSALDHHITRFLARIKAFLPDNEPEKIEVEFWSLSKKISTPVIGLHRDGFRMRIFPVTRFLRFLPLPLEFSWNLLKAIFSEVRQQKKNPDGEKILWHVHSYYLWMYDWIAICLKFLGQKFFAHHRGGGVSFTFKAFFYTVYHYFFALPLTLRFAEKIFVQNRHEMLRLQKFYFLPKEKIVYFPNVIDAAFLTPQPSSETGTLTLLYAGRFETLKGIMPFLEIFEKLQKEFPFLRACFVGSGSLESEMKQFIEFHSLSEKITLIPWQSKEKLLELYRKSSIFIFPNRKSEGSPASLIEALACGLPAIGFQIEGVEDVIQDGVTGFLADDWNLFEEKLRLLIRDEQLRKNFAMNASSLTPECFSSKLFYPKLLSLYRGL